MFDMKLRHFALATITGALVPLAAGHAQLVQPRHSMHAVVNGVFDLCPRLVGGTIALPGAAASRNYGFRPVISEKPSESWMEGIFEQGLVQLRFGKAGGHCTVNYTGPGFDTIAAMVRKVSTDQLKYTKLPTDGGTIEIYARLSANKSKAEQYAVLEDPATQSVAIRYTEKPAG